MNAVMKMMKNGLVVRFAFAAVLSLATIPAVQAQTDRPPAAKISQLAGPWSVSLIGNTGCGWSSMLVTFTLDATGTGTATIQSHTSGCGDNTTTGVTFVVQTMSANGSGTANLSCGADCGWEFNIQVAPNREVFSLVDVYPENPGNYLSGMAVRQL
jgi:hypothetical protein